MKLGFTKFAFLGLPLLVTACGSETPSFVEKADGIVYLSIDKNATDDDSFDVEDLMAEDAASADATAASVTAVGSDDDKVVAERQTKDESDAAANAGSEPEGSVATQNKGNGNGKKKATVMASSTPTSSNTADGDGLSNTPGDGPASISGSSTKDSGTGSGPATGTPNGPTGGPNTFDSKAVAKACLPHFRGLSQKIKVIEPTAAVNMTVPPNTVLAFKLTVNGSRLVINLPRGNDLPGVCFFVSGHESSLMFSTSSQIDGFAYIAAGDRSSSAIEFIGGTPIRSHIELKGNQAALNVTGLDANLCQNASLKGNSSKLQCNP